MAGMRSLGRQLGWLWVAYAISTFGTWFAFDAFALIAIIVLHSGPAAVSTLAAAGRVVGAAVAVPLTIAALTALWGVLGSIVGPRTAIALAGVLLLATPLLLPRRDRAPADALCAEIGN